MEVIGSWTAPTWENGRQIFRNINMTLESKPLNLKIKRLTKTATLPTKAHETDACFDIYADIPDEEYEYREGTPNLFGGFPMFALEKRGKGVAIQPHQTVLIPTGFATEIPHGFWGAIFARSGLASKQGLRPAQGVPVIDEPYRGQWMIPLHNDSEETHIIHHGDRICQFMLLPYFQTTITEVEELDSTDRGEGGFGSTGL